MAPKNDHDQASQVTRNTDDELRDLTVETLRLEAGVSMQEAAILLEESTMSALGARLAKARAKAIELGLARPKVLGVERGPELAVGPETASTSGSRQDCLPDDAFIDQTSERLPSRRLYLRLAREGAFPSKKVGKKVIARWGDVKAAVEAQGTPNQPSSPTDDGLDGLRRLIGLQPKGRR